MNFLGKLEQWPLTYYGRPEKKNEDKKKKKLAQKTVGVSERAVRFVKPGKRISEIL
jgi:hypothetical protein